MNQPHRVHYSRTRTLVHRYRACLLGDWPTLLLLLGQAPLIGYLCTLVWGSVGRDTPSLYFVLCLASLWFGCINACREIVRERPIFERERLFGLRPWSLIWSTFEVLAWIGLLQVILLQMSVELKIGIRGPMPIQLVALWSASLAGTALGLLVSALSLSQDRAVAAIPLLILPQILFSPFTIDKGSQSDIVSAIEKLMPVHWAMTFFEESAGSDPAWLAAFGDALVLLSYTAVLLGASVVVLVPRKV